MGGICLSYIARSLCVFCVIIILLVVIIIIIGSDRVGYANHQSEAATMNEGVRAYHHTSLYGGYAYMLVNGCYKN